MVKLHTPTPVAYENRLGCTGCNSDCDFGEQDWPCSTITAIAEQLGIETGDHR